jgi:hypothetical protein
MTKKSKIVVTAAAVLMVVLPASCVIRDHNLSARFATVTNGMSQVDVRDLLGRPWEIRSCNAGEFAPYDLPGCTEAYVYASAWTPLIPDYPVVWFDRDKRVIGKYHFVSP